MAAPIHKSWARHRVQVKELEFKGIEESTTVAADVLPIPVTHRYVAKTTGADAEALTLADGSAKGQLITIELATDGGGDGTLTPAHPRGFAAIVFADAGDSVTLEWTGTAWVLIGAHGASAPPAITQ